MFLSQVSPDLLGHSGPSLRQQGRDALDELVTLVVKQPGSVNAAVNAAREASGLPVFGVVGGGMGAGGVSGNNGNSGNNNGNGTNVDSPNSKWRLAGLQEPLTKKPVEPPPKPIGREIADEFVAGGVLLDPETGTIKLPETEKLARLKCCSDDKCYSHHGITTVPSAMVAGYPITGKSWRVFLKGPRVDPEKTADEFSKRKSEEWSERSSYCTQAASNSAGHETVIRRLLLNGPFAEPENICGPDKHVLCANGTRGDSVCTGLGTGGAGICQRAMECPRVT